MQIWCKIIHKIEYFEGIEAQLVNSEVIKLNIVLIVTRIDNDIDNDNAHNINSCVELVKNMKVLLFRSPSVLSFTILSMKKERRESWNVLLISVRTQFLR